jgi:hypothetical protein
MSRLNRTFRWPSSETGHFQGGVKLPPRRFADPLRGATPPPSSSPAVVRLNKCSCNKRISETHN